MTFGSLFTGIGGLDLGLERAGMECRWQVEIEPYCVKVLEKHWPNVKRYGDITKIEGSELERVAGERQRQFGQYLSGAPSAFAPGPNDPRWGAILAERPELSPALDINSANEITRAEAQSSLCRVADGIPDQVDRSGLILGGVMQNRTKRLKGLGNAVVPACAEFVGRRMMECL